MPLPLTAGPAEPDFYVRGQVYSPELLLAWMSNNLQSVSSLSQDHSVIVDWKNATRRQSF